MLTNIARQIASRLVKKAHLKLESDLGELPDAVSNQLSNQLEKIEAAEVELFDKFGFAYESTPLMDKLRTIRDRVQHRMNSLEVAQTVNSSVPVGANDSHILDNF